MEMLNTDHAYILELRENDRSRTPDGNTLPVSRTITITEYHYSLRDALNALLLIDIRMFEKHADITETSRHHYEQGRIVSAKDKETILEIDVISFERAMAGDTAAGIYFYVPIEVYALQELTGLDFSEFDGYGTDHNLLQVASYLYDDGLIIRLDPAYRNLWEKRQSAETYKTLGEDEWKYQINIKQCDAEYTERSHYTSYHYDSLNAAFRDMLQIDLYRLDDHLVYLTNAETWITKGAIAERGGQTIVEMVAVDNENTPHPVSEPGIHLHFCQSIEQFERDCKVDLSALGNYGQDDHYLLLANYTPDYSGLLLHPGYRQLVHAPVEKAPPINEPLYKIAIEWELPTINTPDNLPLRTEEPFDNAADALRRLIELPEPLFSKERSKETGYYPLMIKQAIVYENGTEVMNKFEASGHRDNLPNGVYIKLNQDSLSVGLLKLLEPYINTIRQVSGAHFIVTGQGSNAQETIIRNYPTDNKIVIPPHTGQHPKL